MGLGHPFVTLRLAGEAPSLLAAVAHVASFQGTPRALVAHRRGLEDALVAANAAVRPVRAAFANLMPRSVYQSAGNLDPGMFAAVALTIDWPDRSVVECICLGFQVVLGWCPHWGALASGPSPRPPCPTSPPSPTPSGTARWPGSWSASYGPPTRTSTGASGSAPSRSATPACAFGPYGFAEVSRIYGGDDAWRCMDRFAV
eukprot:440288-Prymnesium_polylepis.1